MNKELLDQLSAEERQAAEKLSSAAETMELSQSFQWNLETRLMDAYPSQNEKQNSMMKFLKPVGWALAAVAGVLLVGWMLRTLLPGVQPAAAPPMTQDVSFETSVRQGNICAAPLAVAHNFAVFLTSPDKAQFATVNTGGPMDEVRTVMWSTEGHQLALLVHAPGGDNIYLADQSGSSSQPVLANSELGYMANAAWSRDGRQFVAWSTQNNKILYVINADGSGVVEIPVQVQILGAPQFWPDGSSIVFFGTTPTSFGLFEVMVNGTEAALINSSVESATSYAFSPDGLHLAYMEYDRDLGEARLITEDLNSRDIAVLGTFPISKGSGSSVPNTANMNWSTDGKSIVFDVGRGANDRVVYLARTDGTELLKVVEAGYAPAISSDGKCLAYMNNKQLFLLDLTAVSNSVVTTPMLLGDLPAGSGGPNYQLDKITWRP